MLTTLPLTSKNPFNSLHGIEKHLPCGDKSHIQPIFFPTTCHHPSKVLVADLDEGMGTLVHAGSNRNPTFGLWPLSQVLVLAVREEMEKDEVNEWGEYGIEEVREQDSKDGEEASATSLSAFLREGNEDADWEVVEAPPVVKEKFVLVGRREEGDSCVVSRGQPQWV
jgi:hypothetical protein